jgi:cell division protein ZapA
MGQVTITIDRREYAITCDDGQEAHIIKLSRILDQKAKLLSQNVGIINENMMLAMVGLLLADELQEVQKNTLTSTTNTTQMSDEDLAKSIDEQTKRISAIIKEITPI